MVWILYIEIEEKIRLCEGNWTESYPANSEGWLHQYPVQARYKENGEGKQEKYSIIKSYFFAVFNQFGLYKFSGKF